MEMQKQKYGNKNAEMEVCKWKFRKGNVEMEIWKSKYTNKSRNMEMEIITITTIDCRGSLCQIRMSGTRNMQKEKYACE